MLPGSSLRRAERDLALVTRTGHSPFSSPQSAMHTSSSHLPKQKSKQNRNLSTTLEACWAKKCLKDKAHTLKHSSQDLLKFGSNPPLWMASLSTPIFCLFITPHLAWCYFHLQAHLPRCPSVKVKFQGSFFNWSDNYRRKTLPCSFWFQTFKRWDIWGKQNFLVGLLKIKLQNLTAKLYVMC